MIRPTKLASFSGYRLTPKHQNDLLQVCGGGGEALLSTNNQGEGVGGTKKRGGKKTGKGKKGGKVLLTKRNPATFPNRRLLQEEKNYDVAS